MVLATGNECFARKGDAFGKAEVGEEEAAVVVDERILELEVAVDKTLVMDELGACHLEKLSAKH